MASGKMKIPVWIILVAAMTGFAFCSCFCGCEREMWREDILSANDEEIVKGLLSSAPGVSGRAGPGGRPPGELRSFIAPLKIVTTSKCDDGSIFVRMADSRGFEIDLCVTRCPDGEPYAANTMLIGGEDIHAKSARRPLSENEARLVLSSLEAAAKTVSIDEPDYTLAMDALDGLNSVPKQRLATREEIELQNAGFEKAGLDVVAAEFRDMAGKDRAAIWDKLLPLLTGEFCEFPPADPVQYIIERLGPSEPAAEERMAGAYQWSSDIGFLAYKLSENEHGFVDTACHIRSYGAIQFGTLRHENSEIEPRD